MDIVCAAEYSDEISASIACGMLKSNGIPAFVEAPNMARMYMAGATWAPVRLMVRESDLDKALSLLKD